MYDGCFLGASYYVLGAAEGSTQKALIITYQWPVILIHTNFSESTRAQVLHGCFLLWHHQQVIVYDYGTRGGL